MKDLLLIFCLGIFAHSIFAQNAVRVAQSSSTDSYDLGGRIVKIPAPEKFTDTMIPYPRIAGRLTASESPVNEVLAVHVTNDILQSIKNGEEPDLPFFTKVSVSKDLKSADIEPADFQSIADVFEKESPGMFASVVKTGEKGAGERLSGHWGRDVELKIGESRTLGLIEKQPHSISSLFVVNMEIFQRKMMVVGSMSMVHINKRIIFVYVFRLPSAENDEQAVADLTKAWTARIVAANR